MQRTFYEVVRRGAHLDMKQDVVRVFWRRGASSRALKGILKGEQDWACEHIGKRCPEGTSNIDKAWGAEHPQQRLGSGPHTKTVGGLARTRRSVQIRVSPASSGEALGISK